MIIKARTLLLLSAVLLLGACASRGDRCDRVQEYQSSRSIEPITVPEGLANPAPPGRLIIPDVPPPPADAPAPGCLDRPPDYQVTR